MMKDVIGYEGLYAVTTKGNVWSYPKIGGKGTGKGGKHPGMWLSQIIVLGYVKAHLHKNGKAHLVSVHRLVAQAFIPNRRNLPDINHKNGIKTDNRVENLEWCTQRENNIHALQTGLRINVHGERHHKTKISAKDVRKIRRLYARGIISQREIGLQYGMSQIGISQIIRGTRWSHV